MCDELLVSRDCSRTGTADDRAVAARAGYCIIDPREPLAVALRILQEHGVIGAAEYWRAAARPGELVAGERVYLLVVSMAQYLDHWR